MREQPAAKGPQDPAEELQALQAEAQKLYRFWSDPRNQEGWSGPALVRAALRFLELIQQGSIHVAEDDQAVAAARDYAEMADEMRRLGLLGGPQEDTGTEHA